MPNQSKKPDKSAAALAFATMLSEQLLKQQNPMQTEEEPMQEPPTEDQSLELVEAPMDYEKRISELEGKIEELSKEPIESGDSVLEKIESLKEDGLSRAKVKKAMNQMIDEAYAKENA